MAEVLCSPAGQRLFFLANHSSFTHHNYRDWQSLIRHGEWTIETYPVMEKWQNKPAVKPCSYKLLDITKTQHAKTVFLNTEADSAKVESV